MIAVVMHLIFAFTSYQLTNVVTGGIGMAPPLPSIRLRGTGAGAAAVAGAAVGTEALLMAGKRSMSGQVMGYAPSPVYQPRQPAVTIQQPPAPQPKPAVRQAPDPGDAPT